jgi:hypothetical protein
VGGWVLLGKKSDEDGKVIKENDKRKYSKKRKKNKGV